MLLRSCAFTLLLLTTDAKFARAEMDPTPLLQQALRFRVTVHTNARTGYMVAIGHCRHAFGGCDKRLNEFAHYLKDAGERNGIDPWLLAAMAFRESGMNPFAIGGVGELGILQLHPRSPTSKNIRFVRDGWYRLRCRRQPGACQREVVDRAAEVLARSVVLCGGDMDRALSAYNTGRCGGNRDYARRVHNEVARLKGAVGLADSRLGAAVRSAEAAPPTAPEPTPESDPTAVPAEASPAPAVDPVAAVAEPAAPSEAPATGTGTETADDAVTEARADSIHAAASHANIVHTSTVH